MASRLSPGGLQTQNWERSLVFVSCDRIRSTKSLMVAISSRMLVLGDSVSRLAPDREMPLVLPESCEFLPVSSSQESFQVRPEATSSCLFCATEMPLSLSRSRARACKTVAGNCTLLVDDSLMILSLAIEPLLILPLPPDSSSLLSND